MWLIAVQPEITSAPPTEDRVGPIASEVKGVENFTHMEQKVDPKLPV